MHAPEAMEYDEARDSVLYVMIISELISIYKHMHVFHHRCLTIDYKDKRAIDSTIN
jgi:hypothetical protein